MRLIHLLAAVTPLAGCTAPPASHRADGFAVEPIDREITIDQPLPVRLYVDYRAVSYPGRIVEYGVEIDDRPLTITYQIDPSAALPLQTRLYDGGSPVPVLTALADDRVLEVYAAEGAEAALRVTGYATPATAQIEHLAELTLDPSLRPVLDAVLPARSEIAPVPAFWQNVDRPPSDTPGVGQTSSNGRPIIADWSLDVSLLGALFLQTPCVDDHAGFACPCMRFSAPQIGAIDTCAP